MRKGLIRPLSVLACVILLFAFAQQTVYSATSVVNVYFNGQLLQFDDVQPVIKDGRTLVPFRKLFETLGFTVQWVDSGNKQQAIGTKDGLTIDLTINSTTAKVNGKNVSLDVPAQIMNESTLVPIRFIAENSGYKVSFSSKDEIVTIQIGAVDVIEPYVVKGRAADAQGNPFAGIKIYADNQLNYLSYLSTVTDENGYYRIEMPEIATTWKMRAIINMESGGEPYTIELTPDIDQPFGTSKGAVRDFTYNPPKGKVYVYMDFEIAVNGDGSIHAGNVELALIPIGPSDFGGTGGGEDLIIGRPTIHKTPGVSDFRHSLIVPIGKYRALAQYVVDGEDPLPMLIRQNRTGEYNISVEFDFIPHSVDKFKADLEVLPFN